MDAELQKLVESGKLTAKAAEQLDKLKPGTFCLHKSWGFGRVSEWNLLLNQDGHFFIPIKKNEPIQLRSAPVSAADELLAAFGRARRPKEQGAALDQIIKLADEFKEPDKQLQPIIAAIENAAARNQKLHPELSFELLLGRDDLLARIPQLRTTHVGLTVAKMIAAEEPRLMSILPNLPAAKEKRILQALPEALGERWMNYALRLIYGSGARVVAQIA